MADKLPGGYPCEFACGLGLLLESDALTDYILSLLCTWAGDCTNPAPVHTIIGYDPVGPIGPIRPFAHAAGFMML